MRLRFGVRVGVTLIELLIVIAIVGILAALLYAGLTAVVRSTQTAILAKEVQEVGAALEAFKSAHGVYPPDHQLFDSELLPFIRKAYPSAQPRSLEAFLRALADRTGKELGQPKHVSQSEALVLYLAFMCKDPRDPYRFATQMANDPLPVNNRGVYDPTFRKTLPDDLEVFYAFPMEDLIDHDLDGLPEFSQKYANKMPLIYHDARTYLCQDSVDNELPVAMWPNLPRESGEGNDDPLAISSAYAATFDEVNERFTFINPNSYQLICAGRDGKFGVGPVTVLPGVPKICYPIFERLEPPRFPRLPQEEADNITNFTEGKTFSVFFTQ